jgi:hypothetical protein
VSESVETLAEKVRRSMLRPVSGSEGWGWEAPASVPEIEAAWPAFDAILVRLAEAEQTCDARIRKWQDYYWPLIEACKVERDRYRAALGQIKKQQPETLETIRRNGFVFDSIGHESGNWQHLAFTIYNDLCSVDSIACAALKEQA